METSIPNKVLTAQLRRGHAARLALFVLPLLLLAPAIWNGYPLLQYDTGGYLARWYEGYLVINRSTSYGIYLHLGEQTQFWLNLAFQAIVSLWIIQLTLRVFGITGPFRLAAIGVGLIATTALPWITSMLLTDIFAGLSLLSLFLLIAYRDRITTLEKILLFLFTAFAASTHSATMIVLAGVCAAGWVLLPWLRGRISAAGLTQASSALVVGALLVLGCNYALSGKLTWTPGGSGVAFGRMLQDGIVKRYLDDHCPRQQLKLCPYKDELPPTGDDFLWGGNNMFDKLGRFEGMSGEMEFISRQALTTYPWMQFKAAAKATWDQLVHVATGEGTNGWLPHTYGIIERYMPDQAPAMRAAKQQHWDINFNAVNWVHVPVALGSMLLLLGLLGHAAWQRRLDDVTLLAGTVALALFGNALICGIISGPHDRYGSRIVWTATFVVMIAAVKHFLANRSPADDGAE
uniref:Glycosyltransferase RgtA/B/C/D-like domain-containing protein n=1 Tax=Rhodopseudomonas palustris (strain DX-1) TaxID=652103 RepID=E6VDZ1_RHOPX